MKKLGLIIISCIFSLLSVHTLYAQEQDKLLQLLKQELAADMPRAAETGKSSLPHEF